MPIPIALQLYSVRDDCAQDLLGTIDRVAKMGYNGVEFAGYHGHSAETLRKRLNDNGLACEGTHAGIATLEDDMFEETVAFHKELGCNWLIIPWLPEETRNTPDACKATGEKLTKIVEKLATVGMRTGFHAHDGDMKPISNGKSAWDLIAMNTPSTFMMQYDTANGMAGGADPVQPILNNPGRGQSVHLKEWSGEHGAKVIGEGMVPWKEVFQACETVGGTEWYVVEHESYEGMSPMEAVDACLRNLRAMGK